MVKWTSHLPYHVSKQWDSKLSALRHKVEASTHPTEVSSTMAIRIRKSQRRRKRCKQVLKEEGHVSKEEGQMLKWGGGEGKGAQGRPGQPPNDLDQGLRESTFSNKGEKYVVLEMSCYYSLKTIKYSSWMVCQAMTPTKGIKRKYMGICLNDHIILDAVTLRIFGRQHWLCQTLFSWSIKYLNHLLVKLLLCQDNFF